MNLFNSSYTANALKAGFLLSIVVVCFFVARSSLIVFHPQIITAVTLDLTLTLPLAYLFFIRKTNVSKLTVVPLFIFGVVAASLILPGDNHRLLDLIKVFALPCVELGMFAYVGSIVYKTRKTYKTLGVRNGADFLENLRETLAKEFPAAAANALSFEIAGFYYALVAWKTRRGDARFFTYHKQSGALPVLAVIAFLAAAETLVFHIILAEWSVLTAWIATVLSVYFLFQLLAHGKAIVLRPLEIADGRIFVRCGLLGDAAIEIETIESVELTTENFERRSGSVKVVPLGKLSAHNLKISLRGETVLNGIYGVKKYFKTIYLSVDEAEKFKRMIEIDLEK